MKNIINNRQNKGITLIALVITIIVLLILSGITLNAVVGENGIIGQAQKAKVKTLEANEREEKIAQGKIEVDGIWYDSIEDYMEDKPIITWETATEEDGGQEETGPIIVSELEIGDLIKTNTGEYFYVIGMDTDTVTLIAKYNLDRRGISQHDGVWTETGSLFAYTNYWSDDWENDKIIDLNIYEIPEDLDGIEKNEETGMPITETAVNNAILKARNYGKEMGGEGRLLSYTEALSMLNSSNRKLVSVARGDYAIFDERDEEKGLVYWTSTTRDDENDVVWYVSGIVKSGITSFSIFTDRDNPYDLDGSRHYQFPGVRPIIEIPKTALQ